MPATLQIQTLGGFRVLRDGVPIPDDAWSTHRARIVLKLLIAWHGEVVTAERIMDAIWPDAPPDVAIRNLYKAISDLRRALEPDLKKPAASTVILSTENGYRFNMRGPHLLDTALFWQQIEAARAWSGRRELEAAAQAYARAAALYAGDYLPDDLYAEWSRAERENLRTAFVNMLLESAEVYARLGRYRHAVAVCRRALEVDSCIEAAYRAIMFYQYAAGDRAQALRVYADCVATLDRELEVEPLPSTQGLAGQIRAGRVPEVDELSAGGTLLYPAPEMPALPYALSQLPFVGRRLEAAQVATAWRGAQAGQGALLLVAGEAGIGKSALVAHSLAVAQASGQLLRATAHELTSGLPYHLLAESVRQAAELLPPHPPAWAAAAARVVPALREHYSSLANAVGGAIDKAGLFDALRCCLLALAMPDHRPPTTDHRPLADEHRRSQIADDAASFHPRSSILDPPSASSGGLAIVLEDLQWADPATLEFLAYLAPHLTRSQLLIVATCRPSEHVAPLLERAGRDAWVQRIAIGALDEAEVVALIARLAGAREDELARRLQRTTGGNPLFVAATLAALFEQGRLWLGADGRWQGTESLLAAPVWPVPQEVQTLVQQRTRALTAAARRVLAVASVIEEGADFATLRAIFEGAAMGPALNDAALLDALDELADADLLADGDDLFRFRHDAFREAIYAGLSAPRRQRLHATAGYTLELRTPEAVGRLAYHFSLSADVERAIRYALLAAEHARDVYDNSTALRYYEQVLVLVGDDSARREQQLDAEIGRARMAYRLGLPAVAERARANLKQLAAHLHGVKQADALIQLVAMYSDADQNDDVVATTDLLLPMLDGPEHTRRRLRTWRYRGYAFWGLGDAAEMARCFEQAFAAAGQIADLKGQATSRIYAGLAYSYLADWNTAITAVRDADALAAQTGDPYVQAIVLNNSVDIWCSVGLWARASEAIERSETLFQAAQIEGSRPALEHAQGCLLLLQGQVADALPHLRQAVALAREQGKVSIEGQALADLAIASAQQGDWVAGRAAFRQALDIHQRLNDQMNLTYTCAHAALACLVEGDVAEAQAMLQPSAAAPFTKHTALYRLAQARTYAARGEQAAATAALAESQSLIRNQAARIDDTVVRAMFLAHPYNRQILDTSV